MAKSTVFTRSRGRAVRLPKAVALPQDVHQVDGLKIGRSRLIVPPDRRWDDLFLSGPRLSDDVMTAREQPAAAYPVVAIIAEQATATRSSEIVGSLSALCRVREEDTGR